MDNQANEPTQNAPEKVPLPMAEDGTMPANPNVETSPPAAAPSRGPVPASEPAQHAPAQRPHTAPAGHSAAPGAQRPPQTLREPNTILIGKKSVMAYVLAVVSQFNNGSPFVKIKARGKIISTAVDVAEIVRHRFLQSAHAKEIKISTEELQSEDGRMSKVSSIEIVLVK